MHLSIILVAVTVAGLIRLLGFRSSGSWASRWQCALGSFLLPPVLLLTTSISVLAMGHHGTMLSHPVGWIGCHIALGFLLLAGASLGSCFARQRQLFQQIRSLRSQLILDKTGRILETPALFAAQIGFWKSELVVSRGLLQTLETHQLEAVLRHEEAHDYYRDTFFFFWLGWMRQFTVWLPQTESFWQELLLLREIRADHRAAQQVDAITLAETLLLVVRSALVTPDRPCTPFYETTAATRLEERIDFLLTQPTLSTSQHLLWLWLLPITLPLLTALLHH